MMDFSNMRSKQKVFEQILKMANDNDVKAMCLNGSLANPHVGSDHYQDYDIVCIVDEIESWIDDRKWISSLGTIALMQTPDEERRSDINNKPWDSYAFLMLFDDGVRIDLTLLRLDGICMEHRWDSLSVVLMDQIGIFDSILPADDRDYWIKKPTHKEFRDCCNEFWWCLPNVAKGIARNQLPYAMSMYHRIVHKELDRMIEWYIGMQHDFRLTTGKWGKYFNQYLSKALFDQYEKTFSDATLSHFWQAVFHSVALFEEVAHAVSEHFQYPYDHMEEANAIAYVKWIKENQS